MITAQVNLTAREGKLIELKQTLIEIKEKIATERGCICCRVCQDTEENEKFIILQEWENERLAQNHLNSENFSVIVGAASVLAHKFSVSVSREKASYIDKLEKSFNVRIVKND